MTTNVALGTGWTLVYTADGSEIEFELKGYQEGEYVYSSTAPAATLQGHALHPKCAEVAKPNLGMNLYVRGVTGVTVVLSVAT